MRSLAGEAIQVSAITDLLSQMSSLRNTLQDAAGQMTPSQRARFESIRLRYAEALPGPTETTPRDNRPTIRNSPTSPGKEIPTLTDTSSTPDVSDIRRATSSWTEALASPASLPALTIPDQIVKPSSFLAAPLPSRPDISSIQHDYASVIDIAPRQSFHFGAVIYGTIPSLQPGAMLRLDIGEAGLYIKGTVPILPHSDYLCYSDGTTGTGYLWTTGRERVGSTCFTVGGSYAVLSRQGNDLRVFAGAGIGRKTVLWEDASGHWVRVEDLSLSGMPANIGILFDLGQFSLMAGLSTLSFTDVLFESGVGFLF